MAAARTTAQDNAVAAIARDLAAVPRDRFVEARAARVKQLRADGQRDVATAVARLRKPSLVTWAVNAASRTEPGAARALVDAVRSLQRPGDLDVRAVTRTVDQRLDSLVDAARVALRGVDERVDGDRLAQVRSALRVAVLGDGCDAFLDARLQDADAAGDDATLLAALQAGAHGRSSRGPSSTSSSSDGGRTTQAPRTARSRQPDAARLVQLREQRDAAQRDVTESRDRARVATRDVRRLQRELEAARHELEEAESAVDAAVAEHERLARAVRDESGRS